MTLQRIFTHHRIENMAMLIEKDHWICKMPHIIMCHLSIIKRQQLQIQLI